MKTSSGRLSALIVIAAWCLLSRSALLAADRVRIGLSSFTPINAAIWIANDRGIFKKHGIDPEVVLIAGAAAGGVSSLIAGDVQFLTGGGGAVISAALNGADVVMVASIVNKGIQRVLARSELRRSEDLRGKRIGVTRLGSSSHMVLLLMLRAWGMKPDDVQTLQVGSSPAMLAALEKGAIDAAVLTEPTFFIAEDQGFRVLADLADMDIYYLHSMIDTTRAYVRTHHDLASRLIKAYVEAIAYFKKNRADSIEIMKKQLRTTPAQTKYLERSYALYNSGYFESAPYPALKGVTSVLEFLSKDLPRARTADPRSFIDSSLVKELDDSGFIKKLYE
ncbi:MAG TPA: ABC transporter substrate-binding protein [Terriglobales bacterium]|nr:ABC transporter substrate-binding protein [Terriglobales bacterium]